MFKGESLSRDKLLKNFFASAEFAILGKIVIAMFKCKLMYWDFD